MATPPPSCTRCAKASVEYLRYCGQHLCGAHLRDFVERRIQKEVRKQGGIPQGVRIAVAVSGGKDSTVALQAMHDLAARRDDVELLAVTIDEGIDGYRPKGVEAAAANARRLGVEHVVRRVQDFAGATMDEIQAANGDRRQCSFCGVFRRRLMNEAAREAGASVLVTGHNLDDTAQSILMNLAQGDLARLARLGPHLEVKRELIPRRMPLRTIPEKEVYLYGMLSGLSWHDEECPYAARAQRSAYRAVLNQLEDAKPGTRHALLRTYEALRPSLASLVKMGPVGVCGYCGEPTSGERCQACRLRDEVMQLAR